MRVIRVIRVMADPEKPCVSGISSNCEAMVDECGMPPIQGGDLKGEVAIDPNDPQVGVFLLPWCL